VRDEHAASLRSRVGLNAANFFLAELLGVVLPFANDLLRTRGWGYGAIGVATSVAGLGVLVAQTPAGLLVDRVRARRALLAAASLVVGIALGVLPLVPARASLIDPLLFASGAAQALFAPLLAALALGLVGHAGLNRLMGGNQAFNHAGNLAAALAAMALVALHGVDAVFYAVAVVSFLAAASTFVIRGDEIDERHAAGDGDTLQPSLRELLADPLVRALAAAVALFHLANAPVMPLVALYVKHLHGGDRQVAGVVLVAQTVMVPVALLAGRCCDRWGRKPVLAVAFVVLPLRIAAYAIARTPAVLIALQALDGVGAGIYGVAVIAVSADLTRGKGGFNALNGLLATALAVGGVLGPLGAGFIVEHLGFRAAFLGFAGLAVLAACVLLLRVPETRAPVPR
jgi:MFS family permease